MAGAWKTSGSIDNQHGVRRTSLARCHKDQKGAKPMRSWLRLATAIAAVTAIGFALPAAAQKSGGILKMYDPDSPPTMSILEEATIGSQAPMTGVFNNLVMYEQHVPQNSLSSIVPDLATGWSWNEDGTALTLPLRKGVKWHDGKPLNAAAAEINSDLPVERGSAKLPINPRTP